MKAIGIILTILLGIGFLSINVIASLGLNTKELSAIEIISWLIMCSVTGIMYGKYTFKFYEWFKSNLK